ncbi:MAG: YetF domain-containing protein [Halanaerobiales bacterium]
MITAISRTFILYLAVIIILRIMGKRQIGELQPYELAITIMISALAALPMEDIDIPLLYSIVPMLLLLIFQEIISYVTLNSNRTRSLICGEPTVLIRNGQLMEKELTKLKINMNDLLEQLRITGYHNLEDIEYAIMETTGNISVIPKSQKRPLTPEDMGIDTSFEGPPKSLIIDGEVQQDNLKSVGLDRDWLQNTLQEYNINSPRKVFYAALDSEGDLFFQIKRSAKN